MNCMTDWTLPDTNAQIFHQRILISACTAGLAAWIHGWHPAEFIAIPDSFVLQHFKKLCPRNTGYGFASLWFRIIPFTCRSSMQMVWFSRTSIVDCFCRKSFLWFVTFSCTRATRIRCLLRLWEPFCFRESLRCSLTSFCIARSRYFGFDTVFPLLSE